MTSTFVFKDIDAVLFDLDGTLIDSAPDLGAAADKMRIDRGMASLPLADYRPMAGAGQGRRCTRALPWRRLSGYRRAA